MLSWRDRRPCKARGMTMTTGKLEGTNLMTPDEDLTHMDDARYYQ